LTITCGKINVSGKIVNKARIKGEKIKIKEFFYAFSSKRRIKGGILSFSAWTGAKESVVRPFAVQPGHTHGSVVAGILADCMARATTSFSA